MPRVSAQKAGHPHLTHPEADSHRQTDKARQTQPEQPGAIPPRIVRALAPQELRAQPPEAGRQIRRQADSTSRQGPLPRIARKPLRTKGTPNTKHTQSQTDKDTDTDTGTDADASEDAADHDLGHAGVCVPNDRGAVVGNAHFGIRNLEAELTAVILIASPSADLFYLRSMSR